MMREDYSPHTDKGGHQFTLYDGEPSEKEGLKGAASASCHSLDALLKRQGNPCARIPVLSQLSFSWGSEKKRGPKSYSGVVKRRILYLIPPVFCSVERLSGMSEPPLDHFV